MPKRDIPTFPFEETNCKLEMSKIIFSGGVQKYGRKTTDGEDTLVSDRFHGPKEQNKRGSVKMEIPSLRRRPYSDKNKYGWSFPWK